MKNEKFLIYSLLIVLSIVLLIDYSKYQNLRVKELDFNMEETINYNLNNNKGVIDMKVLLPFEWEEAYIFEPYTSYENIYKTIGVEYTSLENYILYKLNKNATGLYYDHLKKIIFIKNNKVIYETNYDFYVFDFNKNYYTYTESVFIITRNNGSYILQSNSDK